MIEIKDISGKNVKVDCIACAIQSKKMDLPVKRIFETEHFVVEQDFEYPIEGFLILVSKRHIHSISDFNDFEEREFLNILKRSRKVMREVLGVKNITIIQEEDSSTSHFHVWLFPWYDWMKKEVGSKLKDIKEIMKYSKKNFTTKEHLDKMNKISIEMKKAF